MSIALQALAERFNLLKLRVCVQLKQDAYLPSFKGSMWHGWFGHALKLADEQAFHVLMGEHDNRQPKPYVICPSDDHKTQWRTGELLEFELTLFGEATSLVDNVFLALKLGESKGLGEERVPFSVLSVSSILPTGVHAGVTSYTLADVLANTMPMPLADVELALTLRTPVRLKLHDKIIRQEAPDLEYWLNHVLRRVKQLTQFWVCDDQHLFDHLYEQRPRLSSYQKNSHCYFEDWHRYSAKGKQHLPFGGLKGQVSFYGDIGAALPLLRVGEHLHIGGKTTFGLGKYQLIQPSLA